MRFLKSLAVFKETEWNHGYIRGGPIVSYPRPFRGFNGDVAA